MAVMNKIDILRYLGGFDISPDRVPLDGIGPEGYQRYRLAPDNQTPLYKPGTRTRDREFMPWPKDFDYELLQSLIAGGSLQVEKPRKATTEDLLGTKAPVKVTPRPVAKVIKDGK